ncbi:polyprenyl synthetase family protein [bacterium]|nr:polyprenyl synthetase family protein [bacterium]
MMSRELAEFLARYGKQLEMSLVEWLPRSDRPGTDRFNEALHYALFPGGKRMRPLFSLLAVNTVGGDPEAALPMACAMEYLHTCSLIFDDLPAMDNAPLRRGRPAVHAAFGQDVAILVALALFNQTYALVHQAGCRGSDTARLARLMNELAVCIGPDGMIGGQVVDLWLRSHADERLRPISYLKTTALMRLMLMAGGIVAGAREDQLEALLKYGENLGMAYQLLDDIVDEAEDPATSAHGAGVDAAAYRRNADAYLAEARRGLTDRLPHAQTKLLLEFTDLIFEQLKAQAIPTLEGLSASPMVNSPAAQSPAW